MAISSWLMQAKAFHFHGRPPSYSKSYLAPDFCFFCLCSIFISLRIDLQTKGFSEFEKNSCLLRINSFYFINLKNSLQIAAFLICGPLSLPVIFLCHDSSFFVFAKYLNLALLNSTRHRLTVLFLFGKRPNSSLPRYYLLTVVGSS